MTTVAEAVDQVLAAQQASDKPLGIVVAGHNGSGNSTMWYEQLAPAIRIPLINADRMMMSILPEPMAAGVPFAMETVFSDWRPQPNGTVASKIDRILEMQEAGYFVLLLFVGLSDAELSIGRVMTRIAKGGHAVHIEKLETRFPRTRQAVRAALSVADAAILSDNSREPKHAFTLCRIQMGDVEVFDIRGEDEAVPTPISAWLDVVAPRQP